MLGERRLPELDALAQLGDVHLPIEQVAQDQQPLGIGHGGQQLAGLLGALFQAFEGLLAGILERAAAAGALDRGLEDIDAEEVSVRAEEVVRTDATTGAETKLVSFEVRTRRELASADDALRGQDPAALSYAVNSKSGRAALIVQGLIAVLFAIYEGKTLDEIVRTDAQGIFAELGLSEHLTQQRSNGLASMVKRIHTDAEMMLAA